MTQVLLVANVFVLVLRKVPFSKVQLFTVINWYYDSVEIVVFLRNNMLKSVLFLVVVLLSSNIIILDSFQTHVSSPIITSDKINYNQPNIIDLINRAERYQIELKKQA